MIEGPLEAQIRTAFRNGCKEVLKTPEAEPKLIEIEERHGDRRRWRHSSSSGAFWNRRFLVDTVKPNKTSSSSTDT